MSADKPLRYKRVLLKLSGEMLLGNEGSITPTRLDKIAEDIARLHQLGVQVSIVVGGGNFCRGGMLVKSGFDRVTADHMGMLATVMNALAIRDKLSSHEVPVQVMSAITVSGLAHTFDYLRAIDLLNQGTVMIFAGGTGNPLVTTDTAAAMRAIEIKADVFLKATKVDGVFSADPNKHKDAVLFERLTYQEAIEKELKVMDLSAFCLCRDFHVPVRVFNMEKENVFARIVLGETEGTVIE